MLVDFFFVDKLMFGSKLKASILLMPGSKEASILDIDVAFVFFYLAKANPLHVFVMSQVTLTCIFSLAKQIFTL